MWLRENLAGKKSTSEAEIEPLLDVMRLEIGAAVSPFQGRVQRL